MSKKSQDGLLGNIILVIAGLFILVIVGAFGLYYGWNTFLSPQTKPSQVVEDLATKAPTATITPSAAQDDVIYTPIFQPTGCSFDIPPGANVQCGFVIVPEDRDGDLNDVIQLTIAVFHHTGVGDVQDPVIFLQGGPGMGAVEWISEYYFEDIIAPILKTRDFIVFDQRGAGLSTPSLDCPELIPVYFTDLKGDIPLEERAGRYTDAFHTCRDRLIGEGVNIAAYTSSTSAADVNDIATALGYEQLHLFGISYGARLALTVMRDFPDIVRSAVLDSTLPIESKPINDLTAKSHDMLNVLFEGCSVDPECQAAYPDLENTLYELLDQLAVESISFEVYNPIYGKTENASIGRAGLINAIYSALYSTYMIPGIPQGIYNLRDGNTAFLNDSMAATISVYSGMSFGLFISIVCHEQVYASSPDELEADMAAYPDTQAYGVFMIYGGSEGIFGICETWGAPPFDPLDAMPVESQIPTLILAGEYDPTTPPKYGLQAAQNLSNSYYFELPGMGHAPSTNLSTHCPLSIILDFLDDPNLEPDSACIEEMETVHFVLPYNVEDIMLEPFSNAEYSISGLKPIGWEPIEYGFYNRDLTSQDPAQVGAQSAFVSIEEWVVWFTDNFQNEGLDATPVFMGERQANGYNWKLYSAKYEGRPVDIALADAGAGKTLLVAMLSYIHEHDAMHQVVFLPMIDALLSTD